MVTFWIVFTVVGLVTAAWFVSTCKGDGILLGLFLGAVVGLMAGAGVASVVGSRHPQHMVLTETVPLVTLRNADGVAGSFFLGTGSVESVPYYFYYKPSGDGGYKQDRLQSSANVTVYEEDRTDGALEVYERKFVDPSDERWGADGGHAEYKFRIPRGSLKKQFRLE